MKKQGNSTPNEMRLVRADKIEKAISITDSLTKLGSETLNTVAIGRRSVLEELEIIENQNDTVSIEPLLEQIRANNQETEGFTKEEYRQKMRTMFNLVLDIQILHDELQAECPECIYPRAAVNMQIGCDAVTVWLEKDKFNVEHQMFDSSGYCKERIPRVLQTLKDFKEQLERLRIQNNFHGEVDD